MAQRLTAASKSVPGRAMRRAVEMLVNMTPVAPAYNSFKNASRTAAKSKRTKNQKKKRPITKYSISRCVDKMLAAGCDPFSSYAQGACIPDGNLASSVRSYCRAQYTVTIGTGGVGFLHYFAGLANNQPAVVYSLGNFAGDSGIWLTANNSQTGTSATGQLATPLSAAQLTQGWAAADDRAQYSARIVAAGLTFRYTGREIDKAGQVYAYVHPAHNSSGSVSLSGVDAPNTSAFLAEYPETHTVEASREETFIPLFPVNEAELSYSGEDSNSFTELLYPWSQAADRQPGGSSGYYYTSTVSTVGIPVCTLIFVGTSQTTYTVNLGQHMEIVGRGVGGYSRIPPDSDPVGVRDLIAAYARFNLDRTRDPGLNPTPEFKKALRHVQNMRAGQVPI